MAIFEKVGWRSLHLTIRWDQGQDVPWLLCSTQPGGTVPVHADRRRAHAEATYAKTARRAAGTSKPAGSRRWIGWTACCWSCIWFWRATQFGLRAIRQGDRGRFDRAGRRDLSVIRIGRTAVADCLDRCLHVPRSPFIPPRPATCSRGSPKLSWKEDRGTATLPRSAPRSH